MEYNVNTDDPNVSTTIGTRKKKEWNLEQVFDYPYTVEHLVKTLQVIDGLKTKYPDNEIILTFEYFVRNEICKMFGGSINLD